MKCKRTKDLMGAYIYGDLTPEEMREVRLHAQECAECRQDLESRSAALSSIDNKAPDLTDLERQRIAWFVEGAVHKSAAKPAFRLRWATVAAAVGAAAAGVAIGAMVVSNVEKPPARQAERTRKPAVHATVKIQEEPASLLAKDKSESASAKQEDKARESEVLRITDKIATAMQSAIRGGSGVATTRGSEATRRQPASDEVIEEVTTPAESPKHESYTNPTKLPKPSNLNDARTAPSTGD